MDKNIEIHVPNDFGLKVGEYYLLYNPGDYLFAKDLLFSMDREKIKFIQYLGIVNGNERAIGEVITLVDNISKVKKTEIYFKSVSNVKKYSPGEDGYDSRSKMLEEVGK